MFEDKIMIKLVKHFEMIGLKQTEAKVDGTASKQEASEPQKKQCPE